MRDSEIKKNTDIDRTEVDRIIKQNFQDLYRFQKRNLEPVNVWDGHSDDYRFIDISLMKIIQMEMEKPKLETTEHPKKLTVLDTGTGIGGRIPRLLRNLGVDAYGILAPTDEKLEDYIYIVDAHYLSESPHFKSIEFDFIFSEWTFFHFVDPIKALQEAYRKLKPNGSMLINSLMIPGVSATDFMHILEGMKKEGYSIIYSLSPSADGHTEWGTLIIKKVAEKPELLFPLKISSLDTIPVFYTPTKPLQSFPKEEVKKTYENIKLKLSEILELELEKKFHLIKKCEQHIKIAYVFNTNVIKAIFKELLPLANLPCEASELDISKNSCYSHIKGSFVRALPSFESYVSRLLDHLNNLPDGFPKVSSSDDFIEAIIFMGHQDILSYKRRTKVEQEIVHMGFPKPTIRDNSRKIYLNDKTLYDVRFDREQLLDSLFKPVAEISDTKPKNSERTPSFSPVPSNLMTQARARFSLTATNTSNKTPLEIAWNKKDLGRVAYLLQEIRKEKNDCISEIKYVVNLSTKDQQGKTILMHAIANKQDPDFINWLSDYENQNLNSENGIDMSLL